MANYIAKRYDTPSSSASLDRSLSVYRITDFAPTAERPFVLGLPTGSSPIPTYKHLIKLVKEGKLS